MIPLEFFIVNIHLVIKRSRKVDHNFPPPVFKFKSFKKYIPLPRPMFIYKSANLWS